MDIYKILIKKIFFFLLCSINLITLILFVTVTTFPTENNFRLTFVAGISREFFTNNDKLGNRL